MGHGLIPYDLYFKTGYESLEPHDQGHHFWPANKE